MRILIKNATLIDPKNEAHGQTLSFLIEDGIITEIGAIDLPADRVIDVPNLHVSQGWFDPLVAFGEPGYEERETLAHGLAVAARSGFTHIGLLPDTHPIIDSQNGIVHQRTKAVGAVTQCHPLGTLTQGGSGEQLAELYHMHQAGALAFYDAFAPIQNPQLLKIGLEYTQSFGGLLLSHPSDVSLQQGGMMHEGETSTRLGLKGIPSIAESVHVQRDLEVLAYSGGHLHIPFISTAAAVEHIRNAKKKGLSVSCTVGLPHLYFDSNALEGYNAQRKLFPPLRTQDDRQALREGLLDGTIDGISSMHQPMNLEAKDVEFELATPGTIGLDVCFGLLCTLFPLAQVVHYLTRNKAIFSIPHKLIAKGQAADLTFFDPTDAYTIRPQNIYSTSKNCAYLGEKAIGRALGCFINNTLHWNADA